MFWESIGQVLISLLVLLVVLPAVVTGVIVSVVYVWFYGRWTN